MTSKLLALLAGIANPFAQVRIDSAWEEPGGEVPGINAAALERCGRLVGDVVSSRSSHGLLVAGQPGTGKTHLLARFRRSLLESERGWFVYVPPVTSPDRFWRHLLRHLAADGLRVPRRGGVTQLETAVARHVMSDGAAPVDETARWWARVREAYAPGLELHAWLSTHVLEPLQAALDLHGGVARAIAAWLAGVNRLEARDYLLGGALAEHSLAAIGATETLDDEDPAERAVSSLLRLADPGLVVVFAFDQIEGLQRRPDEMEPLVAFGHAVDTLMRISRNVAVLTCAQVSYTETLRRAVGEAIYDGRIAEHETALRPLGADEAVALVADRLARSTDLQTVRLALRGRMDVDDPCWPLAVADVRALAVDPELTPRRLLKQCREMFHQRASSIAEVPPPPPPPTVDEALGAALASAIGVASREEGPIDEGVYEDGLLRALALARRSDLIVAAAPERDVDFTLQAAGRRTAVSLCNAPNMTSLAGRLRRLTQLHARGSYDRLVVLRDRRLPVSPTARAARAYVEKLEKEGGVFVHPPAEAYAALAALRTLLADAAAGDLTVGDRPVGVRELSAWLAEHLPTPVRDLLDDLGGEPQGPQPRAVAALQELLQREGLLELDGAARLTGLDPTVAREAALVAPDLIGYLPGPPEVLFLHPDGFARS